MTAKHPDASCEKPHRDGMGHGYHSFGRSGYDGYGTDSYTLVKLDQNTTNGNWEIDDFKAEAHVHNIAAPAGAPPDATRADRRR